MKNLSLQAKDIILDLFEQGFTSIEIRFAMEDGAYLKEVGISQELSEEIHNFFVRGK